VRVPDNFTFNELAQYYSLINNNAIFDPTANTFYRIPHPMVNATNASFHPTDLFCSGHMHTRSGNVLFVGGTQYYSPQRSGTRTSFLFNWTAKMATDWKSCDWSSLPNPSCNASWRFAGLTPRGHWYSTLVPLMDGRLLIHGGFVDINTTADASEIMYPFEINPAVEFFDP